MMLYRAFGTGGLPNRIIHFSQLFEKMITRTLYGCDPSATLGLATTPASPCEPGTSVWVVAARSARTPHAVPAHGCTTTTTLRKKSAKSWISRALGRLMLKNMGAGRRGCKT